MVKIDSFRFGSTCSVLPFIFSFLVLSNNLLGPTWDSLVGWLMIFVNLMVILGAFYFETEDWFQEQEEIQKHVSLVSLFWNSKVQPLFDKLFNDIDTHSVETDHPDPAPVEEVDDVALPPAVEVDVERSNDVVVEAADTEIELSQFEFDDVFPNAANEDDQTAVYENQEYVSNGIDCFHQVPTNACTIQ